jgi:hypothetical protein
MLLMRFLKGPRHGDPRRVRQGQILTSSALWLNWPLAGFGLWLTVTAVGAAFAGPHGVWGVDALTAGLGFLFMAALEPRLRRTAGLHLRHS